MDYDDWLAEDKGLHFAAGAITGAVTESALDYLWPESGKLERAVVALIPVVVMAVAKECLDSEEDGNCWDNRDALATVAGGVLAVSVTIRF